MKRSLLELCALARAKKPTRQCVLIFICDISEYKHEIPTRVVTKKSHTYNLNCFILCAMENNNARLARIVEENLRDSREFHLIVPDEYAKRVERMQANTRGRDASVCG